jgi:hypothetical protein
MGGVRRRARALITDRDRDPQEWVRAIGGMERFLAERYKELKGEELERRRQERRGRRKRWTLGEVDDVKA